MAVSYLTTDDLIKSIKRNFTIPTSQNTFTDEDMIAFLNEEMALSLVPQLMSVKQDYLLVMDKLAIEPNKVKYEIPARAAGNKVKEISYLDGGGNTLEMTKVDISNLPFYNYVRRNNQLPYTYFIVNNEINIISTFNVPSGFLQVTYYMRPNQLVMLKDVGVIRNIDTLTGEIFLDKLPSKFNVNEKYDVIQSNSPHKCLAIDLNITTINPVNKSVTLAELPDGLKVGDHFCIALETAIPQIPSDMHPVLAHRAGRRCLVAQGDNEGVQVGTGIINEFQEKTMDLVSDRVEDSPKLVTNHRSILRAGITRRRFRYRGN